MLFCFCWQDGRTALHLAATYGNYEIVKILVSACANVDTTTIKVTVAATTAMWGKVPKLFWTISESAIMTHLFLGN